MVGRSQRFPPAQRNGDTTHGAGSEAAIAIVSRRYTCKRTRAPRLALRGETSLARPIRVGQTTAWHKCSTRREPPRGRCRIAAGMSTTSSVKIPNLRERREAAGLARVDLAVAASAAVNTLVHAERGLPVRPATTKRIEAALDNADGARQLVSHDVL